MYTMTYVHVHLYIAVTVAPDCSTVSCLLPVCKEGEVLVVPEGECCPQCVPDCSAISCLLPVCEKGEKLVVPEGECCPKCVPDTPDCSAVLCLRPVCEEGQKLIVPDGECCPKCVPDNPDCSAVFCLQPVCEGGEELVVPDGECCPRCQPVCTVKGQTFSSCASRCPRICNSPPVFCPAVCVEGCTCPSGQLIDTINNRCVSEDKCPSRGKICMACCWILNYQTALNMLQLLQSVASHQSLDLVRLPSASSFTILQRTSVSRSSMADVKEMATDLTHGQNAFQRVVSLCNKYNSVSLESQPV